MTNRRFPPPWSIECLPGGFKVVDANGQSLAYLYARENDNDEHRWRAHHGRGAPVGEQLRQAAGTAGSDLGFGSAPHFFGCIGLDLDVLRSSLGGKTARGSVGTSTQKTRWAVT